MDPSSPTVLGVIFAVLGVISITLKAVFDSRKRRREKLNEIKNDRKQSEDGHDYDLEHIDRERQRRL